jgi:hypothetical protein
MTAATQKKLESLKIQHRQEKLITENKSSAKELLLSMRLQMNSSFPTTSIAVVIKKG